MYMRVHGCCNIAVQFCYVIIPWQHVLSCMNNAVAGFIMMVPTTLFKSVRLSCHEQFVPTCMNKPVNNTVQAGQLNQCWSLSTTHVQAGQLNHVQACQQPCSSWPAQPCSSLSTTLFKLASSTMFKLASSTMFTPVNRQKQAVRFYMCSFYLSIQLSINCRNNLHKILIHATT